MSLAEADWNLKIWTTYSVQQSSYQFKKTFFTNYKQLHISKVKLNRLADIQHHLLDRQRVKTNPDINLTHSHLNHSIEDLSPENLANRVQQCIKQLYLKRKPRTDVVELMEVIVEVSVDFMLQLGEEKKISFIAIIISTNTILIYTSALFPCNFLVSLTSTSTGTSSTGNYSGIEKMKSDTKKRLANPSDEHETPNSFAPIMGTNGKLKEKT